MCIWLFLLLNTLLYKCTQLRAQSEIFTICCDH
jgi:hypothetical protein